MCISNVGNRRPLGMATTAPVVAPAASELWNRMALKASAVPEPEMEPSNCGSTNKNAHIVVQHDYHDHSHDAREGYQEEHPARGGVTTPFPLKLHEMLDQVVAEGMEHIVSWQPHGRCFVVHKPKEFVALLPQYFKLSKLASFQRQLNLYGFQRLTRGRDRGGYYHELFLKGRVFLAHSIQRIKVKGTGVRARSNPDQEPDFWTMEWVHPDPSADASPSAEPYNPTVDKAVSSLPLQMSPPVPLMTSMWKEPSLLPQQQQQDDDVVNVFDVKTFHYLDPFADAAAQKWTVRGVDELLAAEAEEFFEDFEFPDDIGAEIEDDAVFGDMLEQMIA